jgi:hypothetical protein
MILAIAALETPFLAQWYRRCHEVPSGPVISLLTRIFHPLLRQPVSWGRCWPASMRLPMGTHGPLSPKGPAGEFES